MRKLIKGFENYSIDENAIIINERTGKVLKHVKDNRGYMVVRLKYKVKRVHKLMAETFLDHVSCGMKEVINHKNNNPLDNRLDNLEVVTPRYNNTCHKKNGGYNWQKSVSKWRAQIGYKGINYHLGLYTDTNDCKIAYRMGLDIIEMELDKLETIKLLREVKVTMGVSRFIKNK